MSFRTTTVIVHLPYELKDEPDSAPQLRPRRIMDGFRSAGAEVLLVSGTARQRKVQMKTLVRAIKEGQLTPSLVYSESSGWPNAFSEGKKTSFHPRLDADFLRTVRRFEVPVGLFYRDVYYLDPSYFDVPLSSRLRRYLLFWLGKRDRHGYNAYVDRLYFPSVLMAEQVTEFEGQIDELPPGATMRDSTPKSPEDKGRDLNLLYIGGLGALYKLHVLVRVVAAIPGVSLTICTRQVDWESHKHEYIPLLNDSIKVVHKADDQLDVLYARADLAILAVAPSNYRTFTYPVKLFDYIGAGLPILATKGTLAAQYVEEHSLGWAVPYDEESLQHILKGFSEAEASVLQGVKRHVLHHRESVSWEKRAQKVITDLG